MINDIEQEIERLKMKKVDIVNKMNLTDSFDEKEEYSRYLDIIQKQINVLENMRVKDKTVRAFSR